MLSATTEGIYITRAAALIAVLGIAVVHSTDVFSAIVLRPALALVDGRALVAVTVGDEVIAVAVCGGYAEQVIAQGASVGHKPANLSFAQAARSAGGWRDRLALTNGNQGRYR